MREFGGEDDGLRTGREGSFPGENFTQQDSQAENIAASVHFEAVERRLFRAHVIGGAEDDFLFAIRIRQAAAGGLGDAEVDHLGQRGGVVKGGQHVGGLDVAVDDALLVGVLDGVADADEQFEPLADGQAVLVTEGGDRIAGDPLHHKKRPSGGCRSRIEHPRDARMIHHGERLALHLEAGDDLPVIETHTDQLESHLPFHGGFLLRLIDHAATALAQAADQAVATDAQADFLALAMAFRTRRIVRWRGVDVEGFEIEEAA